MIIGTAGHIDHGKTALVKALTGVDADRLKEEKARGITIDLGFAYLPIEDGPTLGFVDVPGHERFVHTMVAGASGIDFALLAVAADDGVMPQTREHLAILDLLHVEHGLVALTKADLASPEQLAIVTAQIRDATAGTVLEGADILPVSSRTGEGVDHLLARLTEAARSIAERSAEGRFRLAVDRVFTLAGIGVVVTGTVLSGLVRVKQQVLVSPSGLPVRVRSLHAQNRPMEAGRAGDRCALNLAGDGVSKDAIHRGDMILDPSLHAPTDRIDARLDLLPGDTRPVGQWFPARFHHGSAEVGARIVLLEGDQLRAGESADVQIMLSRPIAAAALDRFVIRDVSARHTLGGGRILDLHPPARQRRTAERNAQRAAQTIIDPLEAVRSLLEAPPYLCDLASFARDRTLPAAVTVALAQALGLVVFETGASRIALSPARWRLFVSRLIEQLTAFHTTNPDMQGMGREKLRLSLQPGLPAAAFAQALLHEDLAEHIARDGAFVRLATHSLHLGPKHEELWQTIAPLLEGAARFRPPRVRDVATLLSRPEADVRHVFKLAMRLGRVDQVAHDHFFLRSTVHEMVTVAADLAAHSADGTFTAMQFRDRVDNGRKVAIQVLEFFDRHGVTLNRGTLRRVQARYLDLFGPVTSAAVQDGRESSPVGRPDFKSG